MIQVILAIALILLVAWIVYTIVMWVWALTLDVAAWVEANIVLLLAIVVLIDYVWWRFHQKAKAIEAAEEQEREERYQRRVRIQADLRAAEARERAEKAAKDAQRRAERKAQQAKQKAKQAKEKARQDHIDEILGLCRTDGLHPNFIAALAPLLRQAPKQVSSAQVLNSLWRPLGQPKKSGGMDAWQEWVMGELDASQGFSKLKGQVSKLKSKVVNPMEKDLSALVKTAPSGEQYGRLVGLWQRFEGSEQAHEVIERIYKGEREVYVLSDLGLFQE